MAEMPTNQNHVTAPNDLYDRMEEDPADVFDRIDLEVTLKDDLYEMIGEAIKEAMRLREGFPVRLTASRVDAPVAQPGSGTVIDLYLAETGILIETYFERIASRVADFVNKELP
jgi:hypothetical protein